jgi:hypothetical protein
MATTASKFWFAIAALSFVSVFVYVIAAHGEWYGAGVLGGLAIVTCFLGILSVVTGDGYRDETDGDEPVARFSLPAPWPPLVAVGGGVAVVGAAGHNALLWVGVAIIGIVFAEWMVQGWAERATTDDAYNRELRNRIMSPVEVPLIGLVVILGFLAALSRVLLAVPENGSRVIAIVVAAAILGIAFLIAYRPRIGSSVLAALLALGAVALIAAGIAGGVAGERHVEKIEAHPSAGK